MVQKGVQEALLTLPARSQAEKIGRLKYIIKLLNRLDKRISKMEVDVRVLRKGLWSWLHFDKPYIEKLLEPTTADMAIIDCVMRSADGVRPSDIAKDLDSSGIPGITRWFITKRIQRFNKILNREFGRFGFEKRGHRWAATHFLEETWGALTEQEAKEIEKEEEF